MMLWDGMAFSDRLLLEFFRSNASHEEGVRLRYRDIAAHTGISEPTVQRATTRLHTAGLISREREAGDCYIYKVLSDDRQQSA